MAIRKTSTLLPSIFQTNKNKKFLNATTDQLYSEVSKKRINGFIGRKDALNRISSDNYLTEIDNERQDYQLEPAVVYRNNSNSVESVSGYIDYLNSLKYYGVDTENNNSLFSQKYYNYSGFVDLDKLVNYGEYFWLPAGPDNVQVYTNVVPTTKTYEVSRSTNANEESYRFDGTSGDENPIVYLARGGSYTFTVDQLGYPFWIQSETGTTGISSSQQNISVREIPGVTNNGDDVGSITWTVPQRDSQLFYTNMPVAKTVDLAYNGTYSSIQNKLLSSFSTGIDSFTEMVGKTIIFVNNSIVETDWESGDLYDSDAFDSGATEGVAGTFDRVNALDANSRRKVYQITTETVRGDQVIKLLEIATINNLNRVKISNGKLYGNREFYRDAEGNYQIVPPLVAEQDTFYYVDTINNLRFGTFKLVEIDAQPNLDVNDIITRSEFTSPNGVTFTNGLKIKFDNNVTPVTYANNEYFVEGVGKKIELVPVDELISPETFIVTTSEGYDQISGYDESGFEGSRNEPVNQDFIVINRASADRNPWSRINRWFHKDVIEQTATYNNYTVVIDDTQRAKRPILEFVAGLELYNFGTTGIAPVHIVDTFQTDALSNVNGTIGYFSDGIELAPGMTIIFSKDNNKDIRNKVYTVSLIDDDEQASTSKIIQLVETTTVTSGETVVSRLGSVNQGKSFQFLSLTDTWKESQQKTAVNQEPLFNVYDQNHISFDDATVYPSSNFVGSKLFSYSKNASAVADKVLGFGLTYRNLSNIGDIVFSNDFETDTFRYAKESILTDVILRSGHVHQFDIAGKRVLYNGWSEIVEQSKQFQIFNYVVDAVTTKTFSYEIPYTIDTEKNIKVFVNGQYISDADFTVDNIYYNITFNNSKLVGDIVTIKIYNKSTKAKNSYYEIPDNLENNANNTNFETLTLGQMRNHLSVISQHIVDFAGSTPGFSNIRDLPYNKYKGKILQHSAGAMLPFYMMTNPHTKIIPSMEFGKNEYIRFKNKFLENLDILDLDLTNKSKSVDDILSTMVGSKTNIFPFFYSDMLPWGNTGTTTLHTVDDVSETFFTFNTQFDILTESRKGVLVYINSDLKVYGLENDYTFDTNEGAITFTKNVTLSVNDIVKIIEYNDTNGSFIPPTPTKLGLFPKFVPQKITDTSYRTSKTVIVGHDGSRWIGYNDLRDDIVLELEKRIYNNIKTEYNRNLIDYADILPGYFRSTGSDLTKANRVINKYFQQWSNKNNIAINKTPVFDANDTFTWNYKNSVEKETSTRLPGYWRGIYRWFYDTETPNTTPWEMLGLGVKPIWWQDRYGAAPYTAGNSILWEDLRDGKLYSSATGTTYTTLEKYKRTSLISFIPVDDQGELKSPAQFMVVDATASNTSDSFIFGDGSPVETAWRRSSEWPFVVQILAMLTNPAKYGTLMFDTNLYQTSAEFGQILQATKAYRPSLESFYINGQNQQRLGYNQFLGEYGRYIGINVDDLQTRIQNLNVNLCYKLSGYADKSFLKVVAENATPTSTQENTFIPDEDYELITVKSIPIEKVTYSGVQLIRTGNGYEVQGYDNDYPFFNIVPSTRSGNNRVHTVGGIGFVEYKDYDSKVIGIPYGTVVKTPQQLFDFLVAYQRWLQIKGVEFIDSLGNGIPQDFVMAGLEFGFWDEQAWPIGSVLTLSPAFDRLTITRQYTTVDNIATTGQLKNENKQIIRPKNYDISRIGNTTDIFVNEDEENIYSVNIDPIQYEHVIVFNNTTIFSDIIYQPELGNRQGRLKLIGFKSGNWDGTMHAPGFIINDELYDIWVANKDYKRGTIVSYRNMVYVAKKDHDGESIFNFENWKESDLKTGLLPNLTNRSSQLENFYNVDELNLENEIDEVAKGQIGFRKRDYLENLGLDDISQVKFYQGLLGSKGSTTSINKLINANLSNYDQEISFYEEWGFRVGEYGSTASNQIVEVIVNESKAQSNPTVLQFHPEGEINSTVTNPNHLHIQTTDLYKTPNNYTGNIFKLQDSTTPINSEIQTAGYVRLDDVEYTSFNSDLLETLNDNKQLIGRGDKVWFAKSGATWDVKRVEETRVNLVSIISDDVENQVMFNFDSDHGLVLYDWFFIQNNTTYGGFHRVNSVESPTSVTTLGKTGAIGIADIKDPMFKLASSRFSELKSVTETTPLLGWNQGEKIWVDSDEDNKWAVYYKNEPWSSTGTKSTSGVIASANLGQAVALSQGNSMALVGAPQSSAGKIIPYIKTTSGGALQEANSVTVSDISNSIDSFGAAVSIGKKYAAVGSPDTATNKGSVTIFTLGDDGTLTQLQNIIGASSENFGTQVHITGDDRYMFATAPGSNRIYSYQYTTVSAINTLTHTATGDASEQTFALGFTPVSIDALYVLDANGKVYFAGSDFTISSQNITFTAVPANALKIVIRQQSYFSLTDTITVSGIGASDKLGTSFDATYDGNTIVAGAPFATVNSISNGGQAHVFDQVIETFVGDATTVAFTTTTTLPAVGITVRKNGIEQTLTIGEAGGDGSSDGFYSRSSNTITLRATPSGGDLIEVSTGTWELTQTIDQNAFGGQTVTDSEQFGYSVSIDTQGSFVAIGSPGEDAINPNTGSVLVYANTAKRNGEITSTTGTFNTTATDSIYINGRQVIVSASSSDPNKLVSDIVNANIPRVSAENLSGTIRIYTTNTTADNKLTVTKGIGDTLSEAGIKPYQFIQKITHPLKAENENFGREIAFDKYVNNSSGTTYTQNLVISSDRASSTIRTRYDLNSNINSSTYNQYTTTFDQSSTQFITTVLNSGAAYAYQLMGAKGESVSNQSQFGFVQNLSSQYIDTNDGFGSALAYQDNIIIVGSKDDDAQKLNGGSVYEFKNSTRLAGWSKYRSETARVDTGLINRVALYNKDTMEIQTFLDNIDGAKGKIAGEALAEIDFLTPYDPADYTVDNTTDGDWVNNKLGRVWWDLSTATYINYEQGDDDYSSLYWNTLFPGSSIDVYEWINSTISPDVYADDGTPKDITKYSTAQVYNPATNSVQTMYYFWVKGKRSVPVASEFRNISIDSVATMIADPKAAGISYCGILGQDKVALYNCKSFFNANDTVVSIDFDAIKNNGVVHSEFELVTENDANGEVPTIIYNKLVDSLAGEDSLGNAVPDPYLSEVEKYGIGFRPRQSMFKNNRHAVKVMVQFVNKKLATLPIVRNATLTGLLAKEKEPAIITSGYNLKVSSIVERDFLNLNILATGYKVLVSTDENNDNYWTIYNLDATKTWNLTQIQSYDVSRYWSYQNYYSAGYDSTSIPNYQLANEAELLTLTSAKVGETAKVLSNDDGNYSFFEKKTNDTWDEVIIENGTVQLSSRLYDYDSSDVGTFNVFGGGFDLGQFDRNTGQEIRYIIKTLKDDIFINDLALSFNKLFFRLVEYALHESRSQPDWVIKTSFIKVLHKIRNLDQYPTFKYDNQTFVESFIKEAKPYHTKIREYIPSYEKIDTYGSDIADFDVHAYYDTVEGRFRKPDGTLSGDTAKLESGLNKPWNDNYTYKLGSIVIHSGGTGYIVNPIITISAPQASGGVTATATAITNGDTIVRVNVTNQGSGYTQTPVITVTGAGTGASLLPRVENTTIRDFNTTLKFDRISYSSIVKDWTASTNYSVDDIVSYKNTNTKTQEVYKVTTVFTSGSTFSTENTSGISVMDVYADESLTSAADRIAAYYYPSSGMLGDDIGLLQNGTTYPGVNIDGPNFNQEPGLDSGNFDTVGLDNFEIDADGLTVLGGGSLIDTKIESLFTDLSLGQRPEDIDIDGGKFVDPYNSHAPEELIPGRVFDTLDMEVYTDPGDDYENNGNGWESQVRSFAGDGSTAEFAYGKEFGVKTDFDYHVVYINNTRQTESYAIDYQDQTVKFYNAPALGQTVHVYSYTATGEVMTADKTFIADGSTSAFVLGQSTATIKQLYGFVNGVLTTTTFENVDNRTSVQFPSGNPPQGAHIHIFGFNQESSRDALTQLRTEDKTLTAGTYVYGLTNTIKYAQPMEGNVVVELDGNRLRPSNSKYHTSTGFDTIFGLPSNDGASFPSVSEIKVTTIVNGVTNNLEANTDFTYNQSNGEVTLLVQPSVGDTIIVSTTANAEYKISGNGDSITIGTSVSFTSGQKLKITSFSNHDPLQIETKVFIGTGNGTKGLGSYALDRTATNNAYLWVTFNGVRIHHGDFILEDNELLLQEYYRSSVNGATELIVTQFTENTIQPTIGFRVFYDMLGSVNYRRISTASTTFLTADVLPSDTKIYVNNANALPYATPTATTPGVVFIGSERITYWEISFEDNYITNLRRGTGGTTFTPLLEKETLVVDGGLDQKLPANTTHTTTWYTTGASTASDGKGLQESSTINANFLKAGKAEVPNYLKELNEGKYLAVDYVESGYLEEL